MSGGWVVLVDRTVTAMDPRWPLVIGPFKTEDGAFAKRSDIIRALGRADLDRDVSIQPIDPGKTALRSIVEGAL